VTTASRAGSVVVRIGQCHDLEGRCRKAGRTLLSTGLVFLTRKKIGSRCSWFGNLCPAIAGCNVSKLYSSEIFSRPPLISWLSLVFANTKTTLATRTTRPGRFLRQTLSVTADTILPAARPPRKVISRELNTPFYTFSTPSSYNHDPSTSKWAKSIRVNIIPSRKHCRLYRFEVG